MKSRFIGIVGLVVLAFGLIAGFFIISADHPLVILHFVLGANLPGYLGSYAWGKCFGRS